MKKRFLSFAFALFCLFSLGAHALQIRFEGEYKAKLGGYMVVGESYRLYVDGYDSPDTVTFYTPDMENLQITDGNLVTVLTRDSDPDFMYRIRARDSVTGAIIVDRAVKLLTKADSMSVNAEEVILYPGETFTIVPTHTPSDSTNRLIYLSDSEYFTVSTSGEITAQAVGTGTVRVLSKINKLFPDDDPRVLEQDVTVHVHEHAWSDDWTASDDYHYHACTAEYCKITDISEMPGYAAHIYENDVCTVCSAKKPVRDIDGDGLYDIQTANDFLSFAEKVNAGETTANAKLMNDIDFAGKTLIPVGTAESPYAGTFDGKGYTIRGIDCDVTSDNFGLFGVLYGTVCNVKAEGEIRITGNATYVGGVVAHAKSTLTDDGAVLQNIVSNVNITGDGVGIHVGGVLGSSEGLEGEVFLEKCLYGGKIELPNSRNSIGGVMGYANDGVVIYRCGFTGSVSVKETGYPGGILGYVNNENFGGLMYSFEAGTSTGGLVVGDAKKCGYGIGGNTYTAGQKLFGRASDEAAIYAAYNTEIADWSSGEATYLMNDGMTSSGDVRWRQTLGTDPYPCFDGEIVYRTSRNSYSNTRPDAFVLVEPDYGSGVLLANVRYIKTSFTLAIAYYKDGRLQKVSFEKQQPPLEGVTVGTRLDYGDADEIRVMLFDYNLLTLKPLCISDVYRPEKK